MSILDNGNGRSQPNMHDQIAVDTIEFLLAPLEAALALAAEARFIAGAVGHTAAKDRRAVQPEGLARRPSSKVFVRILDSGNLYKWPNAMARVPN